MFEDLRRAISRQNRINAVEAKLNDDQKQITLLSWIMDGREWRRGRVRTRRSRISL